MENKITWLNYTKTILEKVSFDAILFIKELNKALNILTPQEIKILEDWCLEKFNLSLSLEIIAVTTTKRLKQ